MGREAILEAATSFRSRLPEVCAGDRRGRTSFPVKTREREVAA
jgi:hypothetical protein